MVNRVAKFGGTAEFKSFLNIVIFSFLPPLAAHVTEFKLGDWMFLGSHSSKNQRIRYFLIFCTDDLGERVLCQSKTWKCFNCEPSNIVYRENEWDFYVQNQGAPWHVNCHCEHVSMLYSLRGRLDVASFVRTNLLFSMETTTSCYVTLLS